MTDNALEFMRARLGSTLTAALAGRDAAPDDPRLELACQVWQILEEADGAHMARMWFVGGNPRFGRTPVTAIREGMPGVLAAARAQAEGQPDV
jgi:hypothetical protein